MATRIDPHYCVACNKWERDKPLERHSLWYYHKGCLGKLQRNAAPADPKMFEKLNRAFNKALRER